MPSIHPLSAIWNKARTSGECLCERRIKERKVLVKKGQKKGFAHKRRLKCVTNISPRRLMTYLLHHMVYYHTTLRGSEQRNATIARITIHTHAMILNIKRKSSESCAMRYLLRVTQSTGKAGCRTVPLLNVIRNEVWIFLCKNKEWGEYKRTQQVQPHPWRGLYQNNMHG